MLVPIHTPSNNVKLVEHAVQVNKSEEHAVHPFGQLFGGVELPEPEPDPELEGREHYGDVLLLLLL